MNPAVALLLFHQSVRKALDPNNAKDYLRILNNLGSATRGLTGAAEADALRNALDVLNVDWTSISEGQRDKVINAARASLAKPAGPISEKVTGTFEVEGKKIAGATRASSARSFKLDIETSLTSVDHKVLEATAYSQANYIRDEFGRRADAMSLQAKEIVTSGLSRGLGREAIANALSDKLTEANKSDAYWNVISSTFAARARSYANLSSFADAGIDWFTFEAVMDGRTSVVCRYMHGRRFEVKHAIKAHMHAEDVGPEVAQPWLQQGKNEDGEAILYHKTPDGGRKQVAVIHDDGGGKDDAKGSFTGWSDGKLQAAGVMTPPLHGNCRSTILPDIASDAVDVPDVSYPTPVAPGDTGVPVPPNASPDIAGQIAVLNMYPVVGANEVATNQFGLKMMAKAQPYEKALAQFDLGKLLDDSSIERVAVGQLRATQDTANRDVIALMLDRRGSKDDTFPTVVKFKDKLYLHGGNAHARVIAEKIAVGNLKRLDARLIDLDALLAEATPAERVAPEVMMKRLKDAMAELEGNFASVAAQKEIRSTVRDFIAGEYPGMQSRDIARKAAERDVYVTASKDRMKDALATHHTASGPSAYNAGRVTFRQDEHEKLARAMKKDLSQHKGGEQRINAYHDLGALHSLLHEEFHGFSPNKLAYYGPGQGIEEAITESLARKTMRTIIGNSSSTAGGFRLPRRDVFSGEGTYTGGDGSYNKFIEGLFNSVGKHTGHDNIQDRIETAMVASRERKVGDINTPRQHMEVFVKGLKDGAGKDLSEKARKDLIEELLDEKKGPFRDSQK